MTRPVVQLLLAWMLMLLGAGLLLESGLATSSQRSRTLAAVEAIAGFALAASGVYLRRRAVRHTENSHTGFWRRH